MMYLELWRRICEALGKKGPFTSMRSPGRILASTIGDAISRFTKHELDINSAAIRISSQIQWFSSQRAITELGYQPRPTLDSIRDAVAWLHQHNLLKRIIHG